MNSNRPCCVSPDPEEVDDIHNHRSYDAIRCKSCGWNTPYYDNVRAAWDSWKEKNAELPGDGSGERIVETKGKMRCSVNGER